MSIYYQTGIFTLPPQPPRTITRTTPRGVYHDDGQERGVEEFAYSCQILKVLGHEWREEVDALWIAYGGL